MGVFSWFSKSQPPDYETLLSQLATDINDAKLHLSEILLRERRWSFLINANLLAVWAVWVGLWWLRGLPLGLVGISGDGTAGKVIGVTGVGVGPMLLWLLNRTIGLWFARQRNIEETHLRVLLNRQRKHLEDIKKATNYDSTRKLIERYDDYNAAGSSTQSSPSQLSGPSTPVRRGTAPSTPQSASPALGGVLPNTPRAPGHLAGISGTPVPSMAMTPEAALLHSQLTGQPILPTPQRRWYDRVVDSILGEDPSLASQTQYALVCAECFRHNGLVPSKAEWERTQCGHLNPQAASRTSTVSTPSKPPAEPKDSNDKDTNDAKDTKDLASPTPSHLRSTRRRPGEKSTPRSSRLGQEVFSAGPDEDAEEVDETDET